MVTICKHVSTNLQHCPHTNGLFTDSVCCYVLLDTGLKSGYKVVPTVGNEHGDIKIKDYVVLPCGQDNCIPPHPLILDVTVTHDRYGRSTLHTNGKFTHTVSSNHDPQSDVDLKNKDQEENTPLQVSVRGSV